MRVTGGTLRGKRLCGLRGLAIRPTTDYLRESIFNILAGGVEDAVVLDLFAGTGSLGIEALSRGALWALFIDNSRQSVNLIKKNLTICGYEMSGFVLKRDLTKGLPEEYPLMKKGIDLVFIDPPYGKGFIPLILEKLSERGILASPSIVVAESSKNDKLPIRLNSLRLSNTKIYGETKIDIYDCEDGK